MGSWVWHWARTFCGGGDYDEASQPSSGFFRCSLGPLALPAWASLPSSGRCGSFPCSLGNSSAGTFGCWSVKWRGRSRMDTFGDRPPVFAVLLPRGSVEPFRCWFERGCESSGCSFRSASVGCPGGRRSGWVCLCRMDRTVLWDLMWFSWSYRS